MNLIAKYGRERSTIVGSGSSQAAIEKIHARDMNVPVFCSVENYMYYTSMYYLGLLPFM